MRVLRNIVLLAVFAMLAVGTTPVAAQISEARPQEQRSGDHIGTVDGLRVARTEGSLAVINWNRVAGAESYNVYVDDNPAISDTDGWLTIRDLDFLTSYSVTVTAVVAGVEGPRSAPVTFETRDVTLRDPGLIVDFGIFKLSSTRVPFAWRDAPGTTIELFRDGVQIPASELGDFFERPIDTNVVPGETYVYTARLSSNATGAKGPFGPELTVTVPLGASGPPTLVSSYADTSVTVLRLGGLAAERGNSFEVERNGESIGVFARRLAGANEWFVDDRGRPDGASTYRVRIIGAGGEAGPWSNVAETAPLTTPPIVGT